jgi:hypothetical protein
MTLFARMQSTAANYGVTIALKPMAELAQIPGFPLSAGTADGVDIFIALEASERLQLFLAAHLFGHCQAWARMPELREIDPFQMSEGEGRAAAMRIEGELQQTLQQRQRGLSRQLQLQQMFLFQLIKLRVYISKT